MNWKDLHFDSTVVDLHSHPSLKSSVFHRDIGSKKQKFLSKFFKEKFWPFSGRVTFPKMEQGGMDVLLSTTYVLEQGWIDDMSLVRKLFWLFPEVRKRVVDPTYFNATVSMLDDMENQIINYNDTRDSEARSARLVLSPEMLSDGIENGDMCIIHSIEGAHSLQGSEAGKVFSDEMMSHPESIEEEVLANLQSFYDRGVAYLGLAHFYPNHCVNPVFPYPEYGASHLDWRTITGEWDETKGLTPLGEKVVEKMLDMGMLIDIAHCTLEARKKIYEIVEHNNKSECLMSTHTGAFEINRVSYNLYDWELKWMADHGCSVGIIFMNYWISPVDSGLGLKYIEQTLNHIINVCGTDTAAIGTDFDGFTDPPDEIVDMSELPRLTCYLKGLGYEDDVVEKFLGKNALRVLQNGWKK
jgi:microsomal dipeptidase-like Zn-dependent dipeptidase